jgi:uncharacterized protein YyaL (SSP411 family)
MKDDYDGAEPSATSVAAGNLVVLAHLTGDAGWQDRLARTLQGAAARMEASGRSVPMLMACLSAWHAGLQQVVIVGEADDPVRAEMERLVGSRFLPFAVVLPVTPGESQHRIGAVAEFVGSMQRVEGRTAAYVCRDFACRAPVTDPAGLEAQLP